MEAVDEIVLHMNSILEAGEGDAPASLLVLPRRGRFRGLDGRVYMNSAPEGVIAMWKEAGLDLPVDIEHSTERNGGKGSPAPAVGWITALTLNEDGSIVADISWTDEGRELINSRKYRYYSPAYLVSNTRDKVVKGISSIALTNKPNLQLAALNREGTDGEGEDMENLRIVCNAIGLGEDATEADVIVEINALRSRAADAERRAEDAEARIAEMEADALKMELNSTIEEGIRDGRIMPAQRAYFETEINSREQLESFRKMLGIMPKIMAGGEEISGRIEESAMELNAEERKMITELGITEEEYRKAKEDN